MKKRICGILAVLMLTVLAGGALAEQKVMLPDSRMSVTLPDELEYDGPGTTAGDDADFAYVSPELGLEIWFLHYDSQGVTLEKLAEAMQENYDRVVITRIGGTELLKYETTDPGDIFGEEMKCIGYVVMDGKQIQEIVFWYANQRAADLTAEIISTITDKD